MNVFGTLNSVNVNGHTEKKQNLTYLSWAWAWAEVKKRFPDADYTIYENAQGWNYHTDGRTCWVKTGVTIDGLEHIEYLPVMDFRNNSIQASQVTSYDVNKAIQRSLTKACARHGLGLYIYAGEDLPEEAPAPEPTPAPTTTTDVPPVPYQRKDEVPVTEQPVKNQAFNLFKEKYPNCKTPGKCFAWIFSTSSETTEEQWKAVLKGVQECDYTTVVDEWNKNYAKGGAA